MPPAQKKTAAKKTTAAKTAAEKAKSEPAATAAATAPTAPPPPPAPQAPPPPPSATLTTTGGPPAENVTVEGQTIDPATAAFTETTADDNTGAVVKPARDETPEEVKPLRKKDIPDGLVPHDVNGDKDTWLIAEKDITISFIPRNVKRPSTVLLVAARGTITRQALAERLAMYADQEGLEVK